MKLHITPTLLTFGLWITAQPGWADPLTFNMTLFSVPGSTSTTAIGINNASQIVGSYTDGTGTHGFLDTNGTFTALNFPGSTFTEATGINNLGQIVGFYSGGAFLYQNGTYANLPIPASTTLFSQPAMNQVAINDTGQIVATTNDGHGFLYSNGQLTFLPITGNPSIANGPLFNAAYGVNNNGVIAGTGYPPSAELAAGFLYSNGQYTFHFGGAGPSDTYGINNAGDYLITDDSNGYTWLVKNGVFNELPPVLLHETIFGGFARGLNDSDQIVGSYHNGQGFLATPVPEPGSILLLASGLAGMGLLLRRRRTERL